MKTKLITSISSRTRYLNVIIDVGDQGNEHVGQHNDGEDVIHSKKEKSHKLLVRPQVHVFLFDLRVAKKVPEQDLVAR